MVVEGTHAVPSFRVLLCLALMPLLAGCLFVVPVTRSASDARQCARPLAQAHPIDIDALRVNFYEPTENDGLSQAEMDLYEAIMAHRATLGLPRIPLSRSLTLVAGRHAEDMQKNMLYKGRLKPGTNYHSWSDVDYYEDHRNAMLMWQAPRRLGTRYCADAYEISAWNWPTWDDTLRRWIASDYHGPVIENRNAFAAKEWQAIGIGIAEANEYGGPVYHVWFGAAPDPEGRP